MLLDKTATVIAERASKPFARSLALLLKEASLELHTLQARIDDLERSYRELQATVALKKIGVAPDTSSSLAFFADDPDLLSPGDAVNSAASPMARLRELLHEGG